MNGLYYTSENTIMASLSYNFEEMNTRLSCCTYGRITGTYPAYCSQFSNLNQVCQTVATQGTGSAASAPAAYSFVQDAPGKWVLAGRMPLPPGKYNKAKAGTQGGPITVQFSKHDSVIDTVQVDAAESVEAPEDFPHMHGYTKQERKAFSIIVDEQGVADKSKDATKARRAVVPSTKANNEPGKYMLHVSNDDMTITVDQQNGTASS
jgi:hypothetical protein